jgi:hypothetical protein
VLPGVWKEQGSLLGCWWLYNGTSFAEGSSVLFKYIIYVTRSLPDIPRLCLINKVAGGFVFCIFLKKGLSLKLGILPPQPPECWVTGVSHHAQLKISFLGVWTQGLRLASQALLLLEPLLQPFLMVGISKIGSHELFGRGWLWTVILLISASRVAKDYRRESPVPG